jgi:hypothetical protein
MKWIPITRQKNKITKNRSKSKTPLAVNTKINQKGANFGKIWCVPTNPTHAKREHTLPRKCLKVKVAHFDKKKTNLTPTQLDPDAKIKKYL